MKLNEWMNEWIWMDEWIWVDEWMVDGWMKEYEGIMNEGIWRKEYEGRKGE